MFGDADNNGSTDGRQQWHKLPDGVVVVSEGHSPFARHLIFYKVPL